MFIAKRGRALMWLFLLLLPSVFVAAQSQSSSEHSVILLWPGGAPGSEGKSGEETVRVTPEGDHVVSNVHRPSITVYLPAKDKATGAAVVVMPGGGHVELWMDHEGYRIGQWLSDHGVAAFVLKYRLAKAKDSTYTVEGHSLPDAQRALRLVRSRAAEWGIDPERVGVMGFSAGGNLAAIVSTHFDAGNASATATDPMDHQSSRPDFQALIYPGLPKDETARISKQTPPAFLLCGADDRSDIAEGLPELHLALRHAGVSSELHVFAGVGHGFGLRDTNHGPVAGWLDLFRGWLDTQGFLNKK